MITVAQLLTMLSVDQAQASVYADRLVVIMRDPQPDEANIPLGSDVRFLLVDLSADPLDPTSWNAVLSVQIAGAPAGSFAVGVWSDAGAWTGTVAETTSADPFVGWWVTLEQVAPPVFTSEQVVAVDISAILTGGYGYDPYGHFPYGHPTNSPTFATFLYEFTAEDLTPPLLIAAEAINEFTARLTFDDTMSVVGPGSVLTVASWDDAVERLNVDPLPGVHLDVTAVAAADVVGPVTVPVQWTYADAAARVAATGFTAADVGYLALQEDSSTYWRLDDVTPTWTQVIVGDQLDVTFQWEMTPACLYRITANPLFEDESDNPMDASYSATRFTGFEPEHPAGRFFSHWFQMVPLKNREEDATRDLERFSNCFQELLNLMMIYCDRLTDRYDPDKATDAEIDGMLYDMGNPFEWVDLDLTPIQRRKLLRYLITIYQLKGTRPGIEGAIRFLLGEEVTVIDYLYDGWILGVDELGSGGIAELMGGAAEPFDFSGVPLDLELEVDEVPRTVTFEAADFDTPGSATAAEVVAAINAKLTGGGAYQAVPGTPASVTSGNPEVYNITAGQTLTFKVDGGVVEVVTFHGDDFDVAGSARAAEVAARINADSENVVADDVAGSVRIRTLGRGEVATLEITGGTANGVLGFSTSEVTGADAGQVVIYSDKAGRDASVAIVGGAAQVILGFSSLVVAATGGSVLAPSTQRTLYSFDIETQSVLSSDVESIVRRITEYMKVAHEHLVNIRTAPTVQFPEEWVLGVDELGEGTMLGE